jgi:hypothetical protein
MEIDPDEYTAGAGAGRSQAMIGAAWCFPTTLQFEPAHPT